MHESLHITVIYKPISFDYHLDFSLEVGRGLEDNKRETRLKQSYLVFKQINPSLKFNIVDTNPLTSFNN